MSVRLARIVPIVLAIALAPGCKGLGGLASGFGHVASGLGHVASGVGKVAGSAAIGVAHGVGTAAPLVGRAAVHALPVVEDVIEGVALAPDVVVEGPAIEGPAIEADDAVANDDATDDPGVVWMANMPPLRLVDR